MEIEDVKNVDWSNCVVKVKCKRCGHVWVIRRPEKPRLCPKCKSVYWDIPRKKEKKQNEKA